MSSDSAPTAGESLRWDVMITSRRHSSVQNRTRRTQILNRDSN